MIMPTKYVPIGDSTLGLAAALLYLRERDQTVSSLWHNFRLLREDASFDLFTEAITLLFLLGSVNFDDGLLKWRV